MLKKKIIFNLFYYTQKNKENEYVFDQKLNLTNL